MTLIFTRQGVADECFCHAPDGPKFSVHHHAGHNRWFLTTDHEATGRCTREPLPVGLPGLRDALIEVAKVLKAPVALRLAAPTVWPNSLLSLYPHLGRDLDNVCVYYHHATGTLRSLTENYMLGQWMADGSFELTAQDHYPVAKRALAEGLANPWFVGAPGLVVGKREALALELNNCVLNTPGQELKPKWVEYLTTEEAHAFYTQGLKEWGGTPHQYGELYRQVMRLFPTTEVANPDGTITETRL